MNLITISRLSQKNDEESYEHVKIMHHMISEKLDWLVHKSYGAIFLYIYIVFFLLLSFLKLETLKKENSMGLEWNKGESKLWHLLFLVELNL